MDISAIKHKRFPVFFFLGLSALVLLLAGCAYQTVAHLKRNPWQLKTEQTLEMNYLIFQYTCNQEREKLTVTGTAQLKPGSIPDWAQQAQDVWLGAYLNDHRGRILAKDLKMLQTDQEDSNTGFAFVFDLKPEVMGSPGPLFLTFGYRLVFGTGSGTGEDTAASGSTPEDRNVFFASESALFHE